MVDRYAIILTHNRPELLRECVEAIGPQVDHVIVIDNASSPPVSISNLPNGQARLFALYVPDQPPNLSRLWNLGLNKVEFIRDIHRLSREDPWYVAFLCDDAIAPPGWYDAVTAAMRETGATAGCSNPWGTEHPPRVKTAPDGDIAGRMPGWAFVLDGSKGIRADERLQWWWNDTMLDFDARRCGGMVMIGGYLVPNREPNHYTNTKPELGEQAGRDGEMFAQIHGSRPW